MDACGLLPQVPRPSEQISCDTCPLVNHGSPVVWGEGTPGAPVAVILDNPGSRVDAAGQPTVCGTRQTLYKAMQVVSLSENEVYVTYVVKRRPLRAYDKELERQRCAHHLLHQVVDAAPKVVMALGDVVVKTLTGRQDASVKQMRGTVHEWHGLPLVASYHPLAVRRRPNLSVLFAEDWKRAVDLMTD